MDAGKFSQLNFGNIGGPNRFQKAPAANQNQNIDRGAENQGPRDGVDLGFQPMLQVDPAVLPTDLPNAHQGITAGQNVPGPSKSEPTFSLSGPLGLNFVSETQTQSFNTMGGLTAVNGINVTSLSSVNGITVASVNPLSPKSQVRMPTTSVTSFGLEDSQWITSSGRVISVTENKPFVQMPTTSVTTFGLEDTQWLTTSGRTIS